MTDRSGLLRLLTPDEAGVARREAREDFCRRYLGATGSDLPVELAERWWPR